MPSETNGGGASAPSSPKHVFIGLPSYSWRVQVGTLRSLLADCVALTKRGDRFTLFDEAGNTEIGAARQAIVDTFLASKADCLVFVDDDVMWQAGGLLRLVDATHDVCAGVYPKRKDPISWPVGWLSKPELQAVEGWLQVEHVPAGFLKLSRTCLELMRAAYGPEMFDNIRDGKRRFSEDISFCKRWRSLGGSIWCDPQITMAHIGNKPFAGTLGDWLRAR